MKYKTFKPYEHQDKLTKYFLQKPNLNYWGLLWDMGCITGDTIININRGGCSKKYSIKDFYKKFNNTLDKNIPTKIRSYKNNIIGLHEIENVVYSGIKECYQLVLENGNTIKATPNHEFLTSIGWVRLDELKEHKVMVDTISPSSLKTNKKKISYLEVNVRKNHPYSNKINYTRKERNKTYTIYRVSKHRLVYEAYLNNLSYEKYLLLLRSGKPLDNLTFIDPNKYHVHHKDHDRRNNNIDNLELLTKEDHLKLHGNYNNFNQGIITYSGVKSIEYIGKMPTYDIVCKEPYRNFVANNIVIHNSGKTRQAIDLLRVAAYRENRVPKTLIICPSAVLDNWKREIKMHSYIDAKTVQVVDGTTKADGTLLSNPQKKLKLKQIQDDTKNIFIITMNTVKWFTSKVRVAQRLDEIWGIIERLGIEALIVDESHNFKDNKANRTKALIKFSRQPQLKYRFILTGSPVLQDARDLWSQFYILNPTILGDNFVSFRAKYFYDINASDPYEKYPKWVVKDDNYFNRLRELGVPEEKIDEQKVNKLSNIIYKHANRVMKKDCLDLPPRTYQTLEVPLSKEQKRIYNEMKRDLVAFKDSPKDIEINLASLVDGTSIEENLPEVMSADLSIVKTIRLMQLICGIFTDDEGKVSLIPTEREVILKDTLTSILSNPENKVVIWSVFAPTYKIISNILTEMNIKHVFLNGLQNKDQKQAAQDAFQTDKTVRAIVANPAAGGTGVNLTSGNYDIIYSKSFKLGDWLQLNARTDRGGQTRETTCITFNTANTIDARIYERLIEKAKHAEDILSNNGEFTKSDILKLI